MAYILISFLFFVAWFLAATIFDFLNPLLLSKDRFRFRMRRCIVLDDWAEPKYTNTWGLIWYDINTVIAKELITNNLCPDTNLVKLTDLYSMQNLKNRFDSLDKCREQNKKMRVLVLEEKNKNNISAIKKQKQERDNINKINSK